MKSRFSNEQIVSILNQNKAGTSVNKLCAEHHISKATFYAWRKKLDAPNAAPSPSAPAPGTEQQASA